MGFWYCSADRTRGASGSNPGCVLRAHAAAALRLSVAAMAIGLRAPAGSRW